MTRKPVSTTRLAALAGPCLLLAMMAVPGTASSQGDTDPVEIADAPKVVNVSR